MAWPSVYSRGFCAHKTRGDHVVGRTPEGRQLWRCSDCDHVGTWDDGWMYVGNEECTTCWAARMDSVHCPQCAAHHDPGVNP